MKFSRSESIVTITPVVDAHGRIDDLTGIAGQLIPGDLVVKIDLANVSLLVSSELAQLVDLAKDLTVKGGAVILLKANPLIRRLIAVTRLDSLLTLAA